MHANVSFEDAVVIVTGATGALGSSVCETFTSAGATVIGFDIQSPDDPDALLDEAVLELFLEVDCTDEKAVSEAINEVIDRYDRLDALANIAGTWMGGTPIEETEVDTFEAIFDINLKTMFLMSKHALPHLRQSEGAIVSVSARSSLEGGSGDGPYRASKAGIRLLTETIAEENRGAVRANAVMPSVIDTPMNREMMPDADHDEWVDPHDIADVIAWLCSDGASVTSGAAVPVYGEA